MPIELGRVHGAHDRGGPLARAQRAGEVAVTVENIKECMDKPERAEVRRTGLNAMSWAVRDVCQSIGAVAGYRRLAAETDAEIGRPRRDLSRSLD